MKPNANGFGVEISGADLSIPLPVDVLAEIKQAWADHSVIWFFDQPLTLEELEAFTLQFGNFGAGWHSD
ncbi:MAG: TauD/TfdA family dioxygenase [Parvibaculum sp.]|nr:TauD/TfdA family dioxygenase [Parvibaculum sp.]